jgi:class 3 adenylate cyclase
MYTNCAFRAVNSRKEEVSLTILFSCFHLFDLLRRRFTDTTILFADIAGFTAWSSVREPAQVFTLLETLYKAFDKLANKRKVFKVSSWLIHRDSIVVLGLVTPKQYTSRAVSRSKPSGTVT